MAAALVALALSAALLPLFDKKAEEAMRYFALAVTVATLILSFVLYAQYNPSDAGIQPVIQPTGEYHEDLAPAFVFFRTLTPRHPDRAAFPAGF